MAGSGAAAELSSFTAYAAEEETVITEDVNEEEETVEEAPAEEPEEEAVTEEPAEEPEEEAVTEEPAEEPEEEAVVEEPADEDVTEDVSVEAEELPAEEEEAEEVQEAQTDEFLIDASTPGNSWVENHSMYYIDDVKGYAKGFKTIDGVKYHFNEEPDSPGSTAGAIISGLRPKTATISTQGPRAGSR